MIGIVGGTFDPLHYGHLRPVQHVAEQLKFRLTHYVLCARPPHRDPPVAPAADRYQMLLLGLDGLAGFIADSQEMERPGPSYTVWTLRYFRQRYKDEALCLVLGVDAFLGLRRWHRWAELGALANLVVMPRPGWDAADTKLLEAERPPRVTGGGLIWVSGAPEVTTSSTQLRQRLARGDDVSGELPPTVLEYIQRNGIYG